MSDEQSTRRAPHMEKYVEVVPCVVEGYPDAHNVFLVVGVQRFCITPHGIENKEEANWMRDMLCIALARIADEAKQ